MFSKSEIKESLYNSLKELGLSENEIKLYVMSLSLGPTTITKLSKHLSVNRPNIYKLIRGLEEHGLAQFSERSRYQRSFVVKAPTVVRELLAKKRNALGEFDQRLVSAMPDLLSLYKQGEVPTKIRVMSGEEEFLKVFDQSLEEAKEEMQFFGSTSEFIGFITWKVEKEWIKRRIKKGLKMRVLALPSDEAKALKSKDREELRETRIIKEATPFATSFLIFANKVTLWQPKAQLVVLIEDQYFVEMLRSMFEWMWEKNN